jgi:hypothetical protein
MVELDSDLKSCTSDCKSENDLDLLRSTDCSGGTNVSCDLTLGWAFSREKDREDLDATGAEAAVGVGPLIVIIDDDVDV